MKTVAEELRKIVDDSERKLKSIDNWDYRSAPEKWSKKEILGHLIDSATNNHQRFVRIPFEDKPTIRYNPNKWVEIQNYDEAEINSLIDLWISYNNHLAFVLSQISDETNQRKCDLGKEEPATLEWIAKDYLRHLQHHLAQIVSEL